MAWHSLTHSTTADSSDVNDNFTWVGSGSRLPMSSVGANMANTTGQYDLGSSTYRWSTLFGTNIDVTGSITTADKSLMVLIAETTLSVTAAVISFTGLNGDDYKSMMIIARFPYNTGTAARFIFNQDSGTNYGYQRIEASSTSIRAERSTAFDYIRLQDTPGFGYGDIYSKTGNERLAIMTIMGAVSATTILNIELNASIWNNTASTITSIQVFVGAGNAASNTNIQLWGRK